MYIMFPIGWMYYFGTNLEDRFSVPNFWPSQQQSNQIPFEWEEIKEEVTRIARQTREREARRRLEEAKSGGIQGLERRRPEKAGEEDGGGTDAGS
jgi:protein PET100, fungi type